METFNKKSIFLDFNSQYCTSTNELLESETFYKILKSFIHQTKKKKPSWWEEYDCVINSQRSSADITDHLIHVFKLITVFPLEEITDELLTKKELLLVLIEELYNYWRHFERYAFILNNGQKKGLQKISFMNAESNFSNLVLTTYRLISEKLMLQPYRVYRQVSAGSNASFILQNGVELFKNEYESLNSIRLIHTLILHAPFIVYPKNTKRNGIFKEVEFNPIKGLVFNKKDWFCFPLKVGNHRARVFFHKDYMNLGVT